MNIHTTYLHEISMTIDVAGGNIKCLGRYASCFKYKKSTEYCMIVRNHNEVQAVPCSSCFEKGYQFGHCCLRLGHYGPGVYWMIRNLHDN